MLYPAGIDVFRYPCYTKLPEKCRARSGKPVLPVKIVETPANPIKNGESSLVGVLAGYVVVLPHLTEAVLARYDPGQDVYSPGKPAIHSRLPS